MCQKVPGICPEFSQNSFVIGFSLFSPPIGASCILQNLCFAEVVLRQFDKFFGKICLFLGPVVFRTKKSTGLKEKTVSELIICGAPEQKKRFLCLSVGVFAVSRLPYRFSTGGGGVRIIARVYQSKRHFFSCSLRSFLLAIPLFPQGGGGSYHSSGVS